MYIRMHVCNWHCEYVVWLAVQYNIMLYMCAVIKRDISMWEFLFVQIMPVSWLQKFVLHKILYRPMHYNTWNIKTKIVLFYLFIFFERPVLTDS